MSHKTVLSQLLCIILTLKYTYKANGYLKMYLLHGKQIKHCFLSEATLTHLKTLPLWLQNAHRWPTQRPQFRMTCLFCTLQANAGKDGKLGLYRSKGHFAANWHQGGITQIFAASLNIFLTGNQTWKKLLILGPWTCVPARQPAAWSPKSKHGSSPHTYIK